MTQRLSRAASGQSQGIGSSYGTSNSKQSKTQVGRHQRWTAGVGAGRKQREPVDQDVREWMQWRLALWGHSHCLTSNETAFRAWRRRVRVGAGECLRLIVSLS